MCDVLELENNKGLKLISALRVAWKMLPSGTFILSPCFVLTLFTKGVYTLMQFCVMHVSKIPYIGLLVGDFPLQLIYSLYFCIKYYDTLLLLLLIKRWFVLVTVSDPLCHTSSGIPRLSPSILLRGGFFLLVPLWFSEASLSVVVDDSTCLAVWSAPQVSLFFLVHFRVGYIGGLAI